MPIKYLPKPKSSFIQWHITERCNLRCKHCYQTSYATQELPSEKLIDIFYQYVKLLELWEIPGRIQLTGGEPFLRQDVMFQLLELCHNHNKIIPFYGIMSNGFFITEMSARKLKKLGIDFFQVSLEGMEKTNDAIRGRGSFKKIIQAVKILVNEGIRTSISFTSNKTNWKDYPKLIELAKKLGADVIWSDRMIPVGSGNEIRNQMLQPLEVKKFYEEIADISKEMVKSRSKTKVGIHRTLYFLATGDMKSATCCAVGTRGLTIMPNGDVYPCRRMPIRIGNLNDQSLFEIWYSSDLLWKLRDKTCYMNSICKNCRFFDICAGGAPCLTYGYCGDPFAPDPQCWIAFDKLPDSEALASTTSIENLGAQPMFWDNIAEPRTNRTISSYFEINGGVFFYIDHNKRNQLVKTKNHLAKGKNIFLEINDKNIELEKLAKKIIHQRPDKIFISFSFKDDEFPRKSSIIDFMQKLKEGDIDFKLTRPLPKSLFGQDYLMARKFHSPLNLKESLELFFVNNGVVEFPLINRRGPPVKYIRNRNQICEYFEILNSKLEDRKKIENRLQKAFIAHRGDENKIVCYQ